jgi:hypothetical protein
VSGTKPNRNAGCDVGIFTVCGFLFTARLNSICDRLPSGAYASSGPPGNEHSAVMPMEKMKRIHG